MVLHGAVVTAATPAGESGAAAQALWLLAVRSGAVWARRGEYAAAESLLQVVSAAGSAPPAALDLLARIRAQQGRVAETRALWTQALKKEPVNPRYRACLERALRVEKHASTARIWYRWSAVVGTVAVCLLLA